MWIAPFSIVDVYLVAFVVIAVVVGVSAGAAVITKFRHVEPFFNYTDNAGIDAAEAVYLIKISILSLWECKSYLRWTRKRIVLLQ